MRVRHKHDLDRQVALDTGLPIKKVREVTSLFVSGILEALAKQDDVVLPGFGQLSMSVSKGRHSAVNLKDAHVKNAKTRRLRVYRHFRVHFAKSPVFKRLLREKYGPSSKEE